jgi:hypothetical protein
MNPRDLFERLKYRVDSGLKGGWSAGQKNWRFWRKVEEPPRFFLLHRFWYGTGTRCHHLQSQGIGHRQLLFHGTTGTDAPASSIQSVDKLRVGGLRHIISRVDPRKLEIKRFAGSPGRSHAPGMNQVEPLCSLLYLLRHFLVDRPASLIRNPL